jgi:phosphatidylglycerol lysyltransferase
VPDTLKVFQLRFTLLRKVLHGLVPIFALLLFIAAIALLHHNLKQYHIRDIIRSIHGIHGNRILLSSGLTCLGYLVLSGYDMLALRYIKKPLAYGSIVITSFISYAFANNTGSLSIIASGSVRYRLYGAWGLSAVEIGKVIAFCLTTFWLGFLTLGGVVFLSAPQPQPVAFLQQQSIHLTVLGAIFIILVISYLLVCAVSTESFKIAGWEIAFPRLRMAFCQLGVSVTDWLIAAGVLYVLLPAGHGVSFPAFLSMFLAALIAGLLSNVPGGLGVFESIMLLFLAPFMEKTSIVGPLVAFRSIYYLLPLLIASLLLAGLEISRKRDEIQRITTVLGRTTSELVPQVFALGAFAGGAILLFSGATPAVQDRLLNLKMIVPLPVLELSHFLASLAGMGLLVLASGLRKRLDAAFFLSAFLLGTGIVFSLLKGFDYEEALWLLLLLLALLPCRKQFYRKASLLAEPLSPGWFGAVSIILFGSLWLGFFSYKHVEYSHDLWWQFTLAGDAPRFLRASAGVIISALFFAAMKLFKPAPAEPVLPGARDLETALHIAKQSPRTYGYLAQLGDKALLFDAARDTFLMYGVEGRSWIVMGDPVGEEKKFAELLWNFKGLCDQYGGRPVFYEVGRENLHLYLDIGLTPIKIGEQGRVPLETFSLEGPARKDLRHAHNHVLRQGCVFELIDQDRVAAMLPTLKGISDSWLAEKNTQEKGFSLGFFNDRYLKNFPVATVRLRDKVIAFANLLPGGGRKELSIDLMRYLPESPHGVMDYLFVEIMLWGKMQGFRWFDMGIAPLAGLEDRALAPLWNRVGAFVFRYGEHFYNFQGLRFYKEKFNPVWEPKYLAVPGGFSFPKILADIAALIAGGVKGIFLK